MVLVSALLFGACEKELNPSDPGNLVLRTVDQDPSLPAIDVNGTLLHAETFGHPDSAVIIMLHGGPGDDYRSILHAKALADDGYFVVFYDQRGSGLSRRHPKEVYSIQIMLDDLAAVIQKYRKRPDQKIFLLGHSWGAMLATAYINHYPEQINGAVLAEPGGFNWDDTRAYVERIFPLDPFAEASNDVLYYDQFFTGKENQHEILDFKMQSTTVSEIAEGNIIGNAGPFPFWRYGAVASNALNEIARKDGFDFTANLHLFHTKILFLYSELNRGYGLQHALKVSSAYANVQLAEIKGSGHEMFYFAWDNVHPLVRTYFNTLK